uniref:Uncharacterized protein n=1 Tax=Ciona savignyi TaxID=51511 RepID=H2YX69_CIOSA
MLIIVQELDALAAKYSENQKSALWSLSSNLPWPVVLCGVSCSICLLVSTVIGISGSSSVIVGILLLLILALNISAHIWSEGQKRKNITNKLTALAQVIRDALEESSFVEILEEFVLSVGVGGSSFLNSASYSHLYNPHYDKAVLFPTSLVATDDIIGLCVGQSSPCAVACHQDSCIQLSKGDTVNLDDLKCYNCSDPSSLHKFKVLKSPIIEEIQDCLETKAERTKPSKSDLVFYRKIIIRNIVLFLIPLLLVISIVISCVWYMLVPSVDTQGYLLLTLPSHVFSVAIVPTCLLILPILPIMWPIIWVTLVAIGEAKTVAPTLDKQTRRTCFNKWQDILPD